LDRPVLFLYQQSIDRANQHPTDRDVIHDGLERAFVTHHCFDRDAPLCFAFTDGSPYSPVAAWSESTMTVEDLINPDFTNGDLHARVIADFDAAFGNHWPQHATGSAVWFGTVPETRRSGYDINWPLPVPYGFDFVAGVYTYDTHPNDRSTVWMSPACIFEADGGAVDLSLRFEDPNDPTVFRLVFVSIGRAATLFATPIAVSVFAWIFIPPVWLRRRRAGRRREHLCLACGYPLPAPAHTSS